MCFLNRYALLTIYPHTKPLTLTINNSIITNSGIYPPVDYEQSLFILGPSSKTRVTEGARRERHEKRETLFYHQSSRAAALVSCVSLDARVRAFLSLNLKKKRDCLHSNPPAVFTAPRLVRPSKRLKEINQIDHFICLRIKKIVFISKTSHT